MFWLSIGLTVLEMMHPAQIVALALGTILSGKLDIGVEENVVILGDMPNETGAYADHCSRRPETLLPLIFVSVTCLR